MGKRRQKVQWSSLPTNSWNEEEKVFKIYVTDILYLSCHLQTGQFVDQSQVDQEMIKKSSKLKNNPGHGWENCVPPRFEKKTRRILPCHDVGEFKSGFTKIRLADM